MSNNSVDMADDALDQRGGEGESTPLGADADVRLGKTGNRSSRRPTNDALEKALNDYRVDPTNPLLRNTFAIILDQAVRFASRGLVRSSHWFRSHEEDLVGNSWDRLLSQEKNSGELLADYQVRKELASGTTGNRSVYNWVRQNVVFAAGDLNRKLGRSEKLGLLEIPLGGDESGDDDLPTTPAAAFVTETPLKASRLRVQKLTPWLISLAQEMEGETIFVDGGRATLTANHSMAWIDWLALEDDRLLFASDEKAAKASVLSKATFQRYTADAFTYMLQHHQYAKYLPLVLPHHCRNVNFSEAEHLQKLAAALAAPGGKDLFRNLIRASLEKHWDYEQ